MIIPEKAKCSVCGTKFIITHGFFLELDGELTGAVLLLCSQSCSRAAEQAWNETLAASLTE